MKFSTYAGTVIVPTLGRLVLCAAFLTAGWNKCFKQSDYNVEQYETLTRLGVSAWPKPVPPAGGPVAQLRPAGDLLLASFVQDSGQETETPPAAAPPPAKAPPPAEATPPPAKQPPTKQPPPIEPPGSGDEVQPPAGSPPVIVEPTVYQSRAVHHVTLMVEAQGWPYPVMLGWAAALTELFGGALLLVGLFSRIWGLGLAITMAVAFYMTSLTPLMEGVFLDLTSPEGQAAFSGMMLQLSLFVLALGVMMVGAGPISLDHRIFRRSRKPGIIEYDTEHGTSTVRPF